MNRFQNWFLALVIILIAGQLFAQNKAVIGCYQSWKFQQYPGTSQSSKYTL